MSALYKQPFHLYIHLKHLLQKKMDRNENLIGLKMFCTDTPLWTHKESLLPVCVNECEGDMQKERERAK